MTDFLAKVPDQWMLLSIVQQHPAGIASFKLAKIATGEEVTTGVVNAVRTRMLAHRDAGRVTAVSGGPGEVIYKPKT